MLYHIANLASLYIAVFVFDCIEVINTIWRFINF